MSSRFSILGSGNSTGVPWLQCVIDKTRRCTVCNNCIENPSSLNRRNNPSAIISHRRHSDGRQINILIDVGKTFRESVLQNFEKLGISHIDAVILTHPHADAFMGLDDLRDISPNKTLPVYLSSSCFDVVARAFHYLVTKPSTKGLFVASLDWKIIEPFKPFSIEGLVVVPLPVEHGPPGPTLGFEFNYCVPEGNSPDGVARESAVEALQQRASDDAGVSSPLVAQMAASTVGSNCAGYSSGGHNNDNTATSRTSDGSSGSHDNTDTNASSRTSDSCSGSNSAGVGSRVLYFSDIVALPADVRAYAMSGPPVDVLVLDALSYKPYPTHFSMGQAVACAVDLRARRTVLVGMSHRVDYYAEAPKLEAYARAQGLRIELGYDGWETEVEFTRKAESLESVAVALAAARNDPVLLRGPTPLRVTIGPNSGDADSATTNDCSGAGLSPCCGPPAIAMSPVGGGAEAAPAAAAGGCFKAAVNSGPLPSTTRYSYVDAVQPEWDDGASPSSSANQAVKINTT